MKPTRSKTRQAPQQFAYAPSDDIIFQKKGAQSTDGVVVDGIAEISSMHPPETQSARVIRKVAIVEDERDLIMIYEFILKDLGYTA
jgi:hypothetical protein